jgi:predicted transcriptional regulator
MAETETRNIALLAIKPEYATQIISRKKKVEFRKVKFRDYVDTVVVYASSPIQMILGWFEVSYIDQDSPNQLWKRHKSYGGIERKAFFDYYSEKESGVAIGISKVRVLEEPVPLSYLDKELKAPQSFSYLPYHSLQALQTAGL